MERVPEMLLQETSEAAAVRSVPEGALARLEPWTVALLLCTLAIALAYGSWRTGLTVDEPSHLISAYLYWHGRDRLPPRDMPPLIRIVGGWPLRLMDLPVPPDLGQPGDSRHEWTEGARLIERLPPERMSLTVFWPRLLLTIFPVLTGFVLWRWARQLFGVGTGLCVLALWVFSPTVLGHGSLFKNDLAATCGFLLFWYSAWNFWRKPSLTRVAFFAGATALVVLSKLSMLFLVAVAPAIVIARYGSRREWGKGIAALALLMLITYWSVVAAYQFETTRVTSNDLNALSSDPNLPNALLTIMRPFEWLSVPSAMWSGVLNLFRSNNTSAVYFLGYLCRGGDPLYFLVALGLKTPLIALLLVLAGIAVAAVLALRRKLSGTDLFWMIPGGLYIALASMSALQLGVRLVLPAWPFLLLLAGPALRLLLQHLPGRCATLVLIALLGVESATSYPNGIAYYNQLAGGPRGSLRYLADSNIDWGQGLPELARWMRAAGVPRVKLAHFGFDKPERYLRPEQFDRLVPPWTAEAARGRRAMYVEPGHYYAISATLLPGYFFHSHYRNWYGKFWNMQPVAAPGGSILIYRVD